MRSLILVVLVAGAVSAAHLAHVPHRGRHVEVARDLYDGSNLSQIAQTPPSLKRRKRCPSRGSSLTGNGQVSTSREPEPVPPPPPKTTETQTTASSDEKPPPPQSRPPRPSPSSSSQSQSDPPPPKPTTKTTQAPPVKRPTPSSSSTRSTQNGGSGPGPTRTQNGAVPSATRGAGSDQYLQSLSQPLNYSAIPYFTEVHHGELTFYGQGRTACGDVYNDRSLTAAISHLAYDGWPGCTPSTNRCGVCGPFVEGRYFIDPGNEVVKGSSHATIGGDYLINCTEGEQCHRPLTATAIHPVTKARVRVAVVDRCTGCQRGDFDVTPAAFLRLTRPDLDLSKLTTAQLMEEALLDPLGRHEISWQFDPVQQYGDVQHV